MNTSDGCLFTPLAIAGISHHNASVDTLERARFPDETAFLEEVRDRFRGVMLLQTCNRVEIFVHGDDETLRAFLDKISH